MITQQQYIHRAYLKSPLWQAKRIKALTFYGCICNRCKEHGTDVHHKTYERVGGNELMDDLEIMCRPCHKAHHSVDKMVVKRPGQTSRGINRKAILSSLDPWMKTQLKNEFKLSTDGELYLKILNSDGDLAAKSAAKLIGCDFVFGKYKEKLKKQRLYGQQDSNRWGRI